MTDRDLVLAHPDLAQRLTEQPLNYATPQQWTGFVPPEQWGGRRNASPVRDALVEIVAEARRRAIPQPLEAS